MKRDSEPLFIDTDLVKYARTADTAIEFTNEIDVWSRMEFRFRSLISDLRVQGEARPPGKKLTHTGSLYYSIRQRLD